MVTLETNIGIRDINWVQEFCDIALVKYTFKLTQYSESTGKFGIIHYVAVVIEADQTRFNEDESMVMLRTGMTLLDHINLYCEHPPHIWNTLEDKEEV